MRLLDIIASTLGLLVLAPFLLLIALMIKIDAPGPVLYRAQRVGKGGDVFDLLKFRTMVVDADSLGPAITLSSDSRVTRIGRYLRKYKLDELPQLINVLKGEMSLVGPRPENPRYVAYYTPEQQALLAERPGITSSASIAYRDEASLLSGENWEHDYVYKIMPHKLTIELQYQSRRSFWSDVKLIWQTIYLIARNGRKRDE